VDSLASAEHRVATLAARGYSNTEIAQQLYYAPAWPAALGAGAPG